LKSQRKRFSILCNKTKIEIIEVDIFVLLVHPISNFDACVTINLDFTIADPGSFSPVSGFPNSQNSSFFPSPWLQGSCRVHVLHCGRKN